MAVMEIIHYGNPILKKVCDPVDDFNSLPDLVEDMFDTMYEAEGIGLAANQVGLDMNLFIIDVTHMEETDETYTFVNGKITDRRGESWLEEGCLSIPYIRLDIKRPEFITFQYQNIHGEEMKEEFEGLMARVIQHEMDHLNGVFIIDRVSSAERLLVQRELKLIEKQVQPKRGKKAFVL